MKVLISAPYMLIPEERKKVELILKDYSFEITWAEVKERLEEHELVSMIAQFDGVICGDDRFTSKVYDAATRLKVISKWGTGIDSLNQEEAVKRGISLFRTPDAFTQPVADTTLAYILAFCRGVGTNDRLMKAGQWQKPQGYSLFEKTVGIIGFGTIGQAVAKRLVPFGCRVLAYDIKPIEGSVSLDEIWDEADFITLHTDLNPTSYHLINRDTLRKMKKNPWIINTARGPIIDESALIEALQSGIVKGAGLDVFESEPLPVNSPLRKMENVFLASHNSNSSPSCWQRVHENTIKMLAKGLGVNS